MFDVNQGKDLLVLIKVKEESVRLQASLIHIKRDDFEP